MSTIIQEEFMHRSAFMFAVLLLVGMTFAVGGCAGKGGGAPETLALEEAKSLEKAAYARFRSGDNAGALEQFTALIQRSPQFAFAYADRARVRFNLRDYDEALADINRAMELVVNDKALLLHDAEGNRLHGELYNQRKYYMLERFSRFRQIIEMAMAESGEAVTE